MKSKIYAGYLLALMSVAAIAQTQPTTTAKPGPTPAVTSGVAVKPGTPPAAPVHLGPDPAKIAKAQIASFDSDKDGKVSLQEYLKQPTALFNRTDLNHDGFVTEAELTEIYKRQLDDRAKAITKPAPVATPATKPAAPAK